MLVDMLHVSNVDFPLTQATIIHQSSAVRVFRMTNRLISLATTKAVARANVTVVTTKTAPPRDGISFVSILQGPRSLVDADLEDQVMAVVESQWPSRYEV